MNPFRSKINLLLLFTLFASLLTLNDYHPVLIQYQDQLKSQLKGKLVYKKDTFNPKDYNIPFQHEDRIELIKELDLTIDLECDKMLHVKITNSKAQRWEPPYTISDDYKQKVKDCPKTKSLADFGFKVQDKPELPFDFSLTLETSEYYSTVGANLLFSETFIAYQSIVTSNDIYGFGERYHKFKLNDGIYTSWPNDTGGIREDKEKGGDNLMGIQPLALHKTNKGKFVGLVFNNINAQDVVIKTVSEKEKVQLEHRTIGGIIDYYIYIGDTPDEVLIHMHDVIGQPMLPPYWSLGYHQCRWGYSNTHAIRELVNKFYDKEVPIDSFWGDIDILDEKRIFTLNMTDFADLPLLILDLHKKHYNFVPIVDLGFPKKDTDIFYKKGLQLKAFVMSNYTNEALVSYVWPGEAVFPDFLTDKGVELWNFAMEEYYKLVKYDGIWIDMNEPAMIVALNNTRGEIAADYPPDKNKYEFIPYVPGYRKGQEGDWYNRLDIRTHSMSENAISLSGNPFHHSYNFKPLMAYLQGAVTGSYIVNKLKRRPFVLSRSTMMGMGKVSFHWLGDNNSNESSMRNGVNGIFSFNVFGIPMVGDDICGFNDNVGIELCMRWIALGAFFPFSRNHNSILNQPQDPFSIGDLGFQVSKLSLQYRYSLIRYYYTQMFLISAGKTGSFFKPTFFEYPNDANCYAEIEGSAMIGPALYIIPVYKLTVEDTPIYFPNANWNEYGTWTAIATEKKDATEGGKITIRTNFRPFVYVRGGYIIPRQDSTINSIRNTYDLRQNPTELLIAPNLANSAKGDIVFDDDGLDTLKTANYLHIQMSFNHDQLLFSVKNKPKLGYYSEDILLSKIRLLRSEYLVTEGKLYAQIKDIRGNTWNYRLSQDGASMLVLSISKKKIRLDLIQSITFISNKVQFPNHSEHLY